VSRFSAHGPPGALTRIPESPPRRAALSAESGEPGAEERRPPHRKAHLSRGLSPCGTPDREARISLCLCCLPSPGRAVAALHGERAISFLDRQQRSGFGSNETA
jgi:hypothetical protein